MLKLAFDFEELKETSWGVIVSFIALLGIVTALIVFVFLDNDALCPPAWTTCGLTQPAVFVNAAVLIVLVGGLLWRIAGLRLRDVGLDPVKLREGLIVTLGLWIFSQIVGSALQLVNSHTVVIDRWWAECGAGSILGVLLPRFVSCTLKEEVALRGFLLPQFFVKLRSKMPGRRVLPMVLALAVSQSIFALMHIPCQVCSGTRPADLPLVLVGLFGTGLFLSLVYLRTGNLFVAVGVHALICLPTSLFMPTGGSSWLIYLLGCVLTGMWPLLRHHRHQEAAPLSIGFSRLLHNW